MSSCYQVPQTICHTANKGTIFMIRIFSCFCKVVPFNKGKESNNFPKLMQLVLKECEEQSHPQYLHI